MEPVAAADSVIVRPSDEIAAMVVGGLVGISASALVSTVPTRQPAVSALTVTVSVVVVLVVPVRVSVVGIEMRGIKYGKPDGSYIAQSPSCILRMPRFGT